MKYTRFTMKLVTVALAAVLAIPTGTWAVTPLSQIPTGTVKQGDFLKTVDTVGELKAASSAIITAPFEGSVIKLVPEGTRVSEGDPVAWLDTTEIEDELEEEEAQLELAIKDLEAAKDDYSLQEVQNGYDLQAEQARVELAEQSMQDAEQKYETERQLVEKEISPRSRLDEAHLARLQAAVGLRNARINLKKTEENLASRLRVKQTAIEKAQLEVDRLSREVEEERADLEQAVLKAPVDGEVAYFIIWKNGERAKLAEGDNVWRRLNLIEIPDRSEMLAIVPVNELDIAQVDVGQRATITMDALPGQVFTGTVERKSIVPIDKNATSRDSSNSGSGPREFEVRIKLDRSEDSFFQGMTASAWIETDRIDDTLMVPLEALTLSDEKIGVFKSGSPPQFVPVQVQAVNDQVAAVDASLKAEDRVYLRHPEVTPEEARELSTEALDRVRNELRRKMNEERKAGPPTEDGGKPDFAAMGRPGG